jgi:DNA polymerase-3 subunit delta'
VNPLHGHQKAIAAFRAGLDSGRLHHAWLISGPQGIGKGLFARKAALRLLAEGQTPFSTPGLDVPPHHAAAKLFESGAHPDFRIVEREVWEKPGVLLSHEKRNGTEEPARSIRVDQIRWLRASLAGTTSLSARRAVVIDSVDDLETAGANALLKSLEEPPASTIFLLVSHAPERLLPTIRSRCRSLRLGSLGRADMEAALRSALPSATAPEIAALAEVGEGAPGRAVAYRGLDVPALDAAMRTIGETGDPANQHRSELAQALAVKAAAPRYEAFLNRAPSFIAAAARTRRGPRLAEAVKLWEQASMLSATALRQSLDPQATVFEMGTLLAGLSDR